MQHETIGVVAVIEQDALHPPCHSAPKRCASSGAASPLSKRWSRVAPSMRMPLSTRGNASSSACRMHQAAPRAPIPPTGDEALVS
jgi:hypothetical protein